MSVALLSTLTLLLFLCVQVLGQCKQSAAITTSSGKVIGCQRIEVVNNRSYEWTEYLGIPYAAPPIGELRFKKTVPVSSWNETLNATTFGSRCVQFAGFRHSNESEDCLTLNLVVPTTNQSLNKALNRKSAMVFVHGGAFIIGSSRDYDGSMLAVMGDVLVVTLNYRLGPLGFLSTGDDIVTGNMAFWDIIQALNWLQKNLPAFGGDPHNITLFGESAGAMMVSHLMTSPIVNTSLFQRAILQSGSFLFSVRNNTLTPRISRSLAEQMNCTTMNRQEMLNCLQKAPIENIVTATTKVSPANSIPFSPVRDTELLTANECDVVANLTDQLEATAGNLGSFQVLIGHNSQEGLLFSLNLNELSLAIDKRNISEGVSETVYIKALNGLLVDLSTQHPGPDLLPTVVRRLYEQQFADVLVNRTDDQKRLKWATEIYGDGIFVWPAISNALLHQRESSHSTYFYVFDQRRPGSIPAQWYEGPDWLRTGADHADELAYLFGRLAQLDIRSPLRNITLNMVNYWTNFAKFGNPTPYTNEWPVFTAAKNYAIIDMNGLRKASNPAPELTAFWNAIYCSACQLDEVVPPPEGTTVPPPKGTTTSPTTPTSSASATSILLSVCISFLVASLSVSN